MTCMDRRTDGMDHHGLCLRTCFFHAVTCPRDQLSLASNHWHDYLSLQLCQALIRLSLYTRNHCIQLRTFLIELFRTPHRGVILLKGRSRWAPSMTKISVYGSIWCRQVPILSNLIIMLMIAQKHPGSHQCPDRRLMHPRLTHPLSRAGIPILPHMLPSLRHLRLDTLQLRSSGLPL